MFINVQYLSTVRIIVYSTKTYFTAVFYYIVVHYLFKNQPLFIAAPQEEL